ncbi:hypothetical protein DL768_011538 [Monosporascus sp. mg162]|nr:hypothetical protein DL768_011538 [Monosporascus sp. mg162]
MEDKIVNDSSVTRGYGDEETVATGLVNCPVADWTKVEECHATRKVDFNLLPILGLAVFVPQTDRGNVSNALTSTITHKLGVMTKQINVGHALMSRGIVLLEIPFNVLLQRIGAQKWLSAQIVTWGLTAALQSFMTNYRSYLVTLVLMGLREEDFIPGALYTMSTRYKTSESNLHITLFFLGNPLAAATTSLIDAGILSLGDWYGIARSRRLLIIEGGITVGIGIILMFLPPLLSRGQRMPSYQLRSLVFTQRERYILVRRVVLGDSAEVANKLHISSSDICSTVESPEL